MVELIPTARAARVESKRLRRQTVSLKLTLRESAAHSREQLRAAEAALSRAHARCDEPLPSAWSTLHWTCDDRALAGVLVAVP